MIIGSRINCSTPVSSMRGSYGPDRVVGAFLPVTVTFRPCSTEGRREADSTAHHGRTARLGPRSRICGRGSFSESEVLK